VRAQRAWMSDATQEGPVVCSGAWWKVGNKSSDGAGGAKCFEGVSRSGVWG